MKKLFFLYFLVVFSGVLHASERIVSLKPNITDILLRLGVRDELVGVTTYCTLPTELSHLPRVSDYIKPNLEKVVATAPTLIMTARENSDQKEIERLEALGYRIEWVSFQSIADIYASIRAIAEASSRAVDGERLVHRLEEDLRNLQKRARAKTFAKRLVWVVGQEPLVAVGGRTVFQEFLTILGLDNALSKSLLPYPQLSEEQVLALNPDWLIDTSSRTPDAHVRHFYKRAFGSLVAVQKKQVIVLPAALFLPGPPLWEGFGELLRGLQGGGRALF